MRTITHPAPYYVVVGHVADDILVASDGSERHDAGGAALYAGVAALRLGVDVGVLTSSSHQVSPLLAGARVALVPSPQPTIFVNQYGPSGRTQTIRAAAAPLGPRDLPEAWRSARILHLGPIANEVHPALSVAFDPHRTLRAATPQGWLRRWDTVGQVRLLSHEMLIPLLDVMALDVVVLSDEDIQHASGAVDAYRERVYILIVTHGAAGASIYAGKGVLHVPACPAVEHDPTGAGDVFAAAFLIQYSREKDLLGAARFASAAAACTVEGLGATTIPTAATVAERLKTTCAGR